MESHKLGRRGRGFAGRLAALLVLGIGASACRGPERGALAAWRGRNDLRAEAEERAPPPLADAGPSVAAFPLLYLERTPERRVLEVLWPIFERGRSSESHYFRLPPAFLADRFRDRRRLVIFPIWWHFREERETGQRSVDHLWPLYGIHVRPIDLAPAATHHFFFPLFYLRLGGGRWKTRVFPLASVSSGFLDRGWWLIPVLKAGTGRDGWGSGNRFLYLLDPLFAYERFSIAGSRRPEGPRDVRVEVKVLGGLLGWERADGRGRIRIFWLRL